MPKFCARFGASECALSLQLRERMRPKGARGTKSPGGPGQSPASAREPHPTHFSCRCMAITANKNTVIPKPPRATNCGATSENVAAFSSTARSTSIR